jgi:homoserine O-acetyltransferase
VASGRLLLVPASTDTIGHGTVYFAKFWKQQLQEFLETAPK